MDKKEEKAQESHDCKLQLCLQKRREKRRTRLAIKQKSNASEELQLRREAYQLFQFTPPKRLLYLGTTTSEKSHDHQTQFPSHTLIFQHYFNFHFIVVSNK